MVFRFLPLFLLYINIKIGKIDVNCSTSRWPPVWEQLFTWLSLVVSLMASFCAVLVPTRCLGCDLGRN